jgi:hypothetical protein
MSNKFTFIQTGESESKKYHIICSMCMIDEETFKNLIVLEQLRFINLEKVKKLKIEQTDFMAEGITSKIAPAFRISGNQYFIYDSLKEILDKFVKEMNDLNTLIVENNEVMRLR